MHRARWLAEQRTGPDQKVLFTTFTRNLATDIEDNLRTLCSAELFAKIEVRNLDAWVTGYMRTRKLEHRIVYDRSQDAARQAWDAALALRDTTLDLPESFYAQELDQVVLAQGITTLDAYRTARRTGRGVVLTRAKRDAVWPVFEEYRGQLASRRLKEVDDAYREVADLLLADQARGANYSAIVVDEAQDFGPQALKLMRAMLPAGANDLFLVGDGHQRIYSRNKAVLGRCGIDIRGRSKKLYLNYRTTNEIRQQAVALLAGVEVDDLDDGRDDNSRYRSLSHGPEPLIKELPDLEAAIGEVKTCIAQWRAAQETPLGICVIAHTEKRRDVIALALQKSGVRVETITAQGKLSEHADAIQFATMHRAKGLEFDCVVVVAPRAYATDDDGYGNSRQLLYVSLTRAKRGAALLYA
jgi:superfamily I DNA/RNA helicase